MQSFMSIVRAFFACFAVVVAAPVLADVVLLKGGDRLSGTIIGKAGDVLTLETSYAGKVQIKWVEVVSVQTDKPAKFMLKDRTLLNAQALGGAESTTVLRAGETVTTVPIALADIDYINPPPEVTGEGVSTSGLLNIGLTANRGNTDNDSLFYAGETIVRGMKNRFTIGAAGEQKNEEGTETARRNRGYFKYDHFLSKQWYVYANTDVEEDKFQDLELRTTFGAGSGYQFWETPERNLSLEGGLTYVNNDFEIAEDDGYAAGRWALRYAQYLWGGKTQFFHDHEGLVSVEDPDDLIWRMKTGLRFPLIPNLSATLQYNLEWENNPSPGFEDIDSVYIMSIGYLW